VALAIFDLDNTLLGGDSDFLWGQYLVDEGIVDADTYAKTNAQFYAQYQAGELDIHEYARFAFKPLADHPMDQLKTWRKGFFDRYVRPIILEKGMDLIQHHKTRGDITLIITATNRFITEPIAETYGVDYLLATDPKLSQGRYQAEIEGTPCFQGGKITRLEAWMSEHNEGLAGSWFYSDSHNDLPLLERVDHAIAVDPDEILESAARANDWQIISLR
jgi:HAD superfamily hydrolase (TIGR01490 family)